MKSLIGLLLLVTLCTEARALAPSVQEGSIIFVSRKLKMTNAEPAAPKDFYVDLGERQGLKVNDILDVYRVHPVMNGVAGDASNFVRIPLGELKIILVGEYSSVARVHTVIDSKDSPVLDFASFMLGDTVRPKTNLPFDGNIP